MLRYCETCRKTLLRSEGRRWYGILYCDAHYSDKFDEFCADLRGVFWPGGKRPTKETSTCQTTNE